MTLPQACLLLLAAVLGGALNAVAGGGSFFTFPALLLAGVAPISANATSTVALWPGSVASASAYRAELAGQRERLLALGSISVAGGILGAVVLLHTSQTLFLRMVPFLLLLATLVFAFGGRATLALRARLGRDRDEAGEDDAGESKAGERPSWIGMAGTAAVQFAVAFYGGFFGGGIGIMMLALLAALGMTNIHAMNALKTVLQACINGVAVLAFVIAGAVAWPQALLMIAGAVAGGYGGATVAQRIDPKRVRLAVIVIGFALSIYFFVSTFVVKR